MKLRPEEKQRLLKVLQEHNAALKTLLITTGNIQTTLIDITGIGLVEDEDDGKENCGSDGRRDDEMGREDSDAAPSGRPNDEQAATES